jgi:hypothetical protein
MDTHNLTHLRATLARRGEKMFRGLRTVVLTGAFVSAMCFPQGAAAQSRSNGLIDAGTTVTVRTNETINTRDNDGRVFTGNVEQDVRDRSGNIAIPQGSDVEMIVRSTTNNEIALDLDSIMVNGQRYSVDTDPNNVTTERKDGLGANGRTGRYVGGGAAIGAIIGAITGGGKGAAIGAGAGAAAGAGAQILTRGRSVNVPAESLVTFRLAQPLYAGMRDGGFSRDGYHYHNVYNQNPDSVAYQAGLRAGRADLNRGLSPNPNSRYRSARDRADYEAGYNQAFDSRSAYNNTRQKPGYYNNSGRWNVNIGRNNVISWNGPENASVYVQMDNEAPKLFAGFASGSQAAPWISNGHQYVFMLRDARGNEIARDQVDLRSNRFRR